ncbi:predicted protein [Streptomyces viridosporus ATCC 14672]|uniref:Predicted protein n=1 Tax=Streptomyces viridosporus (strain ATCC 14672 / DSM 40746 / JCM 4963 / KCTC 9882 / NRRL B-12104 / FH 1290) TaxID=566461 RepID=D5ZSW0_STRV1|nr:predicted protein [Streptomyces viridosporus ATCC 14672]
MGRMRAVPPSRSTTSASQWAGYSCRSDVVCMGPRVRLAHGNGARQSVEGDAPDRGRGPEPTREREQVPLPACFTVWETGLDNFEN